MQNYLLSRRTTEYMRALSRKLYTRVTAILLRLRRTKTFERLWDVLCGTDGTFRGSQRAQASLGTTANCKASPHSERELGAD
jgi:hypothetical protein